MKERLLKLYDFFPGYYNTRAIVLAFSISFTTYMSFNHVLYEENYHGIVPFFTHSWMVTQQRNRLPLDILPEYTVGESKQTNLI